jgi:hypothetical protein
MQAIISLIIESYSSHYQAEYSTLNEVLSLCIVETFSFFNMYGKSCVLNLILLSYFIYVMTSRFGCPWTGVHPQFSTVQWDQYAISIFHETIVRYLLSAGIHTTRQELRT